MINVDISNVWGQLSLPELLAMEKEVADAHAALAEEAGREWPELPAAEEAEVLGRIRKAAAKIRMESDVCVVVGPAEGCLGIRAAVELLQGPDRNTGRGKGDPVLFFAGNSLSTRQWNALAEALKGKDLSVIALSESGTVLETAIAFRGLRWLLERKYGTDEAKKRIYAVTASQGGALDRMAEEAGWERFCIPGDLHGGALLLSPAGLLPMAAAGIDIQEVLKGAAEAKEAYDLRSYDNPVWLYAGVRQVLCRTGKRIELVESFEPGFRTFGRWWQQLFGAAEKGGLLLTPAELPADLYGLEGLIRKSAGCLFETMVRFDPPEVKHTIGGDWKDPEGLNYLEGKDLDFVEEQAFQAAAENHGDAGVSVVTMDCGALDEAGVGALVCFLQLAGGISGRIRGSGADCCAEGGCREDLLRRLGKPETET